MASSSSNRMAKKEAIKVTPSTGNVFRDIGFSRDANVATVLRVTQPRVNDLLRGHIDLFSIDSLIDMLARLGVGVRLVVKAPVKPTSHR
jgi:hypothetical protein